MKWNTGMPIGGQSRSTLWTNRLGLLDPAITTGATRHQSTSPGVQQESYDPTASGADNVAFDNLQKLLGYA